jgi:hypothetical protein
MEWRKSSKLVGVGMLAACLALAGCGSKSTNTILVTVLPGSATIIVKQQQSFSASVTGSTNTNVTWTLTISGKDCTPGCGTLDSTTNTTITYTAPATVPSALVPPAGSTTPAAPLTLTATSAASTKKTGTATITLDSGIRVPILRFTGQRHGCPDLAGHASNNDQWVCGLLRPRLRQH